MAGSPPDSKDSPLSPWQGRAGRAAAWACRGGQPGNSYRISSLLSGKVPGEAKMPSQMDGAQAGGGVPLRSYTNPCPQIQFTALPFVSGLCEDPWLSTSFL